MPLLPPPRSAPHVTTTPNLHYIRRQGALALFQAFAEEQIAAGEQPKGLDSAFARKLDVGAATWSLAKSGARNIGDKLARQIEAKCGKPAGWLDEEREPQGLTQAEQQFLASALKAWRATDSAGRKQLKAMLTEVSRTGSVSGSRHPKA